MISKPSVYLYILESETLRGRASKLGHLTQHHSEDGQTGLDSRLYVDAQVVTDTHKHTTLVMPAKQVVKSLIVTTLLIEVELLLFLD